MAILKFKKLIADLENNTTTVLSSVTKVASTASNAGTAAVATTAANAGTSAVATTAVKSGSAAYSGTAFGAQRAHWASSGTASLKGTSIWWGTSGIGA